MKKILKIFFFFIIVYLSASFLPITSSAQPKLSKVFTVKNPVDGFASEQFYMAYRSDGMIYTYRSYPISSSDGISNYLFNPTGHSIAIIRRGKYVEICSFLKKDEILAQIKEKRKKLPDKPLPAALCYSSDARELLISNTLGEIVVYSTGDYLPHTYISAGKVYSDLKMSKNTYYVAATSGNEVDLWNYEARELRKTLSFPNQVTGVAFSPDSRSMAVTFGNDGMQIIDTRTLDINKNITGAGFLSSPVFHPDGKYLAVIKNGNICLLFNLATGRVEYEMDQYLKNETDTVALNGIKTMNFVKSEKVSIIHNVSNGIVLWDVSGLDPFFTQIVTGEVGKLMNDWVRQMDGESLEDYAVRVNDETRALQEALFTEEIATSLAQERVSLTDPFMGEYNDESGLLDISFSQLAPIAISVPQEDVESFSGGGNMSFENAIYILNENDEFEIAYVEVVNETTNKRYIYNNIKRSSLINVFDPEDNPDYIPLEIVQMVSMAEIKLEEKKNVVVEEKMSEDFITLNTQISVNSSVEADYNANGDKIYNYKVGYQYDVLKGFSAKEDFPSGKYLTSHSNAAISMLEIIKNAFEDDLGKYIEEGKQIEISITGSADGGSIKKAIPYSERYGPFVNEPCYINGELVNITVTKGTGITKNDQLSIVRAAGFKHYMEKEIPNMKMAKRKYILKGNIADEEGGEHRRINVDIVIKDAFTEMNK